MYETALSYPVNAKKWAKPHCTFSHQIMLLRRRNAYVTSLHFLPAYLSSFPQNNLNFVIYTNLPGDIPNTKD